MLCASGWFSKVVNDINTTEQELLIMQMYKLHFKQAKAFLIEMLKSSQVPSDETIHVHVPQTSDSKVFNFL